MTCLNPNTSLDQLLTGFHLQRMVLKLEKLGRRSLSRNVWQSWKHIEGSLTTLSKPAKLEILTWRYLSIRDLADISQNESSKHPCLGQRLVREVCAEIELECSTWLMMSWDLVSKGNKARPAKAMQAASIDRFSIVLWAGLNIVEKVHTEFSNCQIDVSGNPSLSSFRTRLTPSSLVATSPYSLPRRLVPRPQHRLHHRWVGGRCGWQENCSRVSNRTAGWKCNHIRLVQRWSCPLNPSGISINAANRITVGRNINVPWLWVERHISVLLKKPAIRSSGSKMYPRTAVTV